LAACLVTALAFLISAPPEAFAQAREHFLRGQTAYKQGKYELAIREWEKAYRLEKRPRIQYNLALAYERIARLDDAIVAMEKFVESADPEDPAYADATARLASLKERLMLTGIKITGGVEGSLILVDGQKWGLTPRPDRIPVKPGAHTILIRHDGYSDFVSNVVVPAGQEVAVAVEMKVGKSGDGTSFFEGRDRPRDLTASGDSDVSFYDGEDDESESGGDPLLWYLVSGGLGAGAVGTAIWTVERHGELSDCEKTGTYYCPNEDTVRAEERLALLTTIVFAGGAIGALVYGLLLDAEDDAPEEDVSSGDETEAISCAPRLTGAGCTVRF
jgi:hypothetical protein